MNNVISDFNHDPYARTETEEERQAIYKELLTQYEKDTQEYTHKKEVYDNFSKAWICRERYKLITKNVFIKVF